MAAATPPTEITRQSIVLVATLADLVVTSWVRSQHVVPKLDKVSLTQEVHHEARHARHGSVVYRSGWLQQYAPHKGLLCLVNVSFNHVAGILELR